MSPGPVIYGNKTVTENKKTCIAIAEITARCLKDIDKQFFISRSCTMKNICSISFSHFIWCV